MSIKQQLATGFLAIMIVGSVAWMPAGAEQKQSQANATPPSTANVTALNSTELPQEQVRDLTYN
ncbi:MAG: hypothetical protein ACXWG1_12705 [Usitatibacter sp.]